MVDKTTSHAAAPVVVASLGVQTAGRILAEELSNVRQSPGLAATPNSNLDSQVVYRPVNASSKNYILDSQASFDRIRAGGVVSENSGASKEDVKALQEALSRAAVAQKKELEKLGSKKETTTVGRIATDGIFGDETAKAISAFQRNENRFGRSVQMPVTGDFGPQTLAAVTKYVPEIVRSRKESRIPNEILAAVVPLCSGEISDPAKLSTRSLAALKTLLRIEKGEPSALVGSGYDRETQKAIAAFAIKNDLVDLKVDKDSALNILDPVKISPKIMSALIKAATDAATIRNPITIP